LEDGKMLDDIGRMYEKMSSLEKRTSEIEKIIAVTSVEFVSVKSDLKDIKDSLTWVTRLIIGALILAVLAFVFGGGLNVV
jgi:hypothetical protein